MKLIYNWIVSKLEIIILKITILFQQTKQEIYINNYQKIKVTTIFKTIIK